MMHGAICDECGKDCEVPFKPTGDKPVYCSDCFKGKRETNPRKFSERDSGRFNSGDKKMYQAVCDECGNNCEVPFNPSGDKPVYCSQCFGQGKKNKSPDQAGRQFEIINAKLDKILKALSPAVPAETSGTKKEKTIPAKSKPAPKAKTTKPNPLKAAKKPSQTKKTTSPKKTKSKPKKKK
ncbi:hypothetical protein COV49_00170 [Candidatus Falkowbacteria bacterium CG11_big_fil_rev_8_21_14_0_20_39_10]|uniref:CxxC-x17-CxxC domain-containing protein n=1 Tax=Candidatus Falkowbacteria bacterium CG11_big_fil_rev_8_21_14_0_20_39_10 TaxID=1974570 RepID=A0A2M6KA59_9BACT|nr:MAG: hypothetical protein COV49_00170 [Candidatus Falkowbacteria bacterium CG11_big_fil_rev_8_21_14_0_20_39_10]